MGNPSLQSYDGVAAAQRGDLIIFLYAGDARLHRTRWAFDRADELARRSPDGILVFFVIPPGSAPPDAATRGENATRFKKLLPAVRRFVTLPLGDALRVSIVKAVMRAMILIQRQKGRQVIANSEDEGITLLLERASADTPDRPVIEADLRALREMLLSPPAKAS